MPVTINNLMREKRRTLFAYNCPCKEAINRKASDIKHQHAGHRAYMGIKVRRCLSMRVITSLASSENLCKARYGGESEMSGQR